MCVCTIPKGLLKCDTFHTQSLTAPPSLKPPLSHTHPHSAYLEVNEALVDFLSEVDATKDGSDTVAAHTSGLLPKKGKKGRRWVEHKVSVVIKT